MMPSPLSLQKTQSHRPAARTQKRASQHHSLAGVKESPNIIRLGAEHGATEHEVTKTAFYDIKRYIPPFREPGMLHLKIPGAVFVTAGSGNCSKRQRPCTHKRKPPVSIIRANEDRPVSNKGLWPGWRSCWRGLHAITGGLLSGGFPGLSSGASGRNS